MTIVAKDNSKSSKPISIGIKIQKWIVRILRHFHIIQFINFRHYSNYRKACHEKIPYLTAIEETKKRILFIAPYMSMGGAEKVILDLAKSLDREKYVVDIISITNNQDGLNLWNDLYAEAADHLWHLPDIIHRAFRSAFIYHIARIRKYDVVLMSHASVYIETLAPVLKILPISKKYCIIHDVYPDWSFEATRYDFFWNKYICVCSCAAQLLTDLKGIPAGKIEVIPNGVDTHQFNPACFSTSFFREKLKIRSDEKLVAFVGRMSSEKHPEYLIQVAKLNRDLPYVRFVMAGDGPMLVQLRRKVKEEGLEETIFLLGAIENIPQLMSEIDLLYLCSEMEGFGLCIFESLAMGKPAVVPRVVMASPRAFKLSA